MGVNTDRLTQSFTDFIEKQKVFFVATAAANGRVNMSPKGLDSLRVIDKQHIVWLSVTGSGNETAAHLLQNPRMTLMFCAFEGQHLILRVYGTANAVHARDAEWGELYKLFPDYAGARSIFKMTIDLVTTSCGSGVPEMSLVRTRAETDLVPWYAEMGEAGVERFWRKKNIHSLDGDPTGLFEDDENNQPR